MPTLSESQRIGENIETFSIIFDTTKGALIYKIDDPINLKYYQLGSKWKLEVNQFDAVISVTVNY